MMRKISRPARDLKKKIVLYFSFFSSGGADKRYLELTPYFLNAGFEVIFLVDQAKGPLLSDVPKGVQIVEFGFRRLRHTLPALVSYLRQNSPDLLLTFCKHKNIVAIWAKIIAGSKTILVSAICNPIKPPIREDNTFGAFILPFLFQIFFRFSDRVIAVSEGVRYEIIQNGYYRDEVKLIYNGIIPENFTQLIEEQFDHPWFHEEKTLVYVAAGRLEPQKDFETLIRALQLVTKVRPAKLLLFGEGTLFSSLKSLSDDLGVSADIDFLGYVKNIYPAISKASAFVLSSGFEGFGLVLVEALACGTPVVSTDCPYGPSEILANGKYGKLVPVGDHQKLAEAMLQVAEQPIPSEMLINRGLSFSLSRCAEEYIEFFRNLIDSSRLR